MKHVHLILWAFFLLLTSHTPGAALDCGANKDITDAVICGDDRLQSADAEVKDAYEKALRYVPEGKLHTMLIESQKRWKAALDRALERSPERSQILTGSQYPTNREEVAAVALRARLYDLTAEEENGTPNLIARALENEKHELARYLNGEFAGYETSCEFMAVDFSYSCISTRTYRNKDRLCTVQEHWTSAGPDQNRYVANVTRGKPRLIASCSLRWGADSPCPIGVRDDGRWNTKPLSHPELYTPKKLPKVDGEVLEEDEAWIMACLTERSFPLADPARNIE